MSTVLLFAILGAASGAIYALLAFGIVLTYRATGVVNFASGAMAMVATFTYWQLHDNAHVTAVVAIPAGVAVAVGLGWLTHRLMRPLTNASMLIKLALTLTLLVVLEAAVGLHWSAGVSYVAQPILPATPVRMFGFGVSLGALLLIGIAFVLTAALWLIYRYTRFGLATSATAENEAALATLGWSPNRIAAANWMISGALSGLAGILVAPVVGVSLVLATSLLLPAIASAVVGNMSSFPGTLVGGLLLGIMQAEAQRFVHVSGIASGVGQASPFVAIILVIVVRGRRLPLRNFLHERLPLVPQGKIRVKQSALALVVTLALIWFVLPVEWVSAVAYTAIGAILLLSIVVLTGFAGQISLAQWAIGGCGALVTVHLMTSGVPDLAAIAIGTVSVIPLGLVIGLAALRARGISLAIATLGASAFLANTVLADDSWTGGNDGITVGDLRLLGMNVDLTEHPTRFATLLVLVFALAALFVVNLRRGATGRRMLAIRASERAASAIGIDVKGVKLGAFCYASGLAALGAILSVLTFSIALLNGFANDPFISIQLESSAILGGVGYASGPLVGGWGASGGLGTSVVNLIPGASQNSSLVTVITGVLTILVITRAPNGLVPLTIGQSKSLTAAIRRVIGRRQGSAASQRYQLLEPAPRVGQQRSHLLKVTDLSVRFGPITALEGVTLSVASGEVVGVIGPNGAGKTTLLDSITGFVTVSAGAVHLDDKHLTGASPRSRSVAGISRSFQSLELFEDMTVFENIVVACERHSWARRLVEGIKPCAPRLTRAASDAIREFELEDVLGEHPAELSGGTRRAVALARAIASGPRILLLDEPAAGLDVRHRQNLCDTIGRLAREHGIGVLLIEHDVDLVCSVSDRLIALDFGRVIASGRPDEVRRDPQVITSYVGSADTDPAETGASTPARTSG